MFKRKAKHESERPLGCWQVAGIALVTLLAFLLFYEPIASLLR